MQTRAELFGPHMAAVKLKTYEYFAILCKLCKLYTLPLDLAREIGGRIWALNILTAESEFNAYIVDIFMAQIDINMRIFIKLDNIKVRDMIENIVPDVFKRINRSNNYRPLTINKDMKARYNSTVIDIFRVTAANFTSFKEHFIYLVVEF